MQFLYKINDMIPEIFDEIRRTYNFKYLRIDGLHSVFVKDNYAIALSVGRDYVNISYFIKEGTTIINYWLHPFLMENLNDEDRSVCLENDNKVETKLINYILLYEKTLKSKWKNILSGQMDWVEEYNKKSSMRSVREFYAAEYIRFKSVFGTD